MQWGDFLIVVVISGTFILLVLGSHMFLNHYGMWFLTTDERLLRKNTASVQKLKVKRYLFLLALGECGRGHFVPRGCASDNFQTRVFQSPLCKHIKTHARPRPTCQQAHSSGARSAHWRCSLPALEGPKCECCNPPSLPRQSHDPPLMLLLQGSSLPERCAWEGRQGRRHHRRRHLHHPLGDCAGV